MFLVNELQRNANETAAIPLLAILHAYHRWVSCETFAYHIWSFRRILVKNVQTDGSLWRCYMTEVCINMNATHNVYLRVEVSLVRYCQLRQEEQTDMCVVFDSVSCPPRWCASSWCWPSWRRWCKRYHLIISLQMVMVQWMDGDIHWRMMHHCLHTHLNHFLIWYCATRCCCN